ncbi:MAG: hypothetical protein KJZ84_23895 [Bryobacteraceae bacterium]|nr:hypothetical protein [Bryobacteraceae bacterium]
MFKTITRPDHSERILAVPPEHCISLAEAKLLRGVLLEKLPRGSTIEIQGAPAGSFSGEDYPEKWLNDNIANHDRPLVLRLRINANIGQVAAAPYTANAAALAALWMRSPREAFESVYAGCGASQAEIERFHLTREPVNQAISSLYA